ncbi:transcriptional regulator, TetR family [Sphingobium faniae]|nr:transcriptional regulator, TetR family [Sphingobium faniae]
MRKPRNMRVEAADDIAIASLGTMTRLSDDMFARRRRILQEARKILEKDGPEGMSMRKLATRADVSLRTLYNAFVSKENIIAIAIRNYYDSLLNPLANDANFHDFNWAIRTVVAINLCHQQVPYYVSVLVNLYFSTSIDSSVKEELRHIGAGFLRPWLELNLARGHLLPGVNIDRTIANLSSLHFSINQEWLIGTIDKDDVSRLILESMLIYMSGIMRGTGRAVVEKSLSAFRDDSGELEKVIAQARTMIPDNPVTSAE